MKNTNIKRQAVFPVLMMLVVTALALIGSSFAWFTVANTASVTQITTSAQTDGVQLQLSQDASRYYTRNLKLNTTNAAGSIFPATLYQVSTNGKLGEGASTLSFYDSEVLGHSVGANPDLLVSTKLDQTVTVANGVLAAAEKGSGNTTYGQAGKTYGEAYEAETPTYIVFDLYMSVDRAAEIYLFNGTAMTAEQGASQNASTDNILKSARVAFVYLGSTAGLTNEDAAKIQPQTGLTGVKSVVIWEPMATEDNSEKVKTYGMKGQTYVDEYEAGEMAAYKLVDGKTEEVTTYESDELIVASKDATAGMTMLFSTTGECYSKLRVYVWLEGNDPDCVAQVASQVLKLNLVFFAKEA